MIKYFKYIVTCAVFVSLAGCAAIVPVETVKITSPVKGASVYVDGQATSPELGTAVRKHRNFVATTYKSGYRPKSMVVAPKKLDFGIVLDVAYAAMNFAVGVPEGGAMFLGVALVDFAAAGLRHPRKMELPDMEKLPVNTVPDIFVVAHPHMDSLNVTSQKVFSYKKVKQWEKRSSNDLYEMSSTSEVFKVENWMDGKLDAMKYQESRGDFITPYDKTVQIDADIISMEVFRIGSIAASVKLDVRFFICDNFGNRLLPFETDGESQPFYISYYTNYSSTDAFKDAMYVAMSKLLKSDEFVNACTNMSKLYTNTTSDNEEISMKKPLIKNPDFQEMVNAQVTISEDKDFHGSGCMISPEGHLLASYRVVGDKDSIDVIFSNGVTKIGKVLRKDPILNIVLLKTDTLGNASISPISVKNYNVGEDVFAVGAPVDRSLAQSLTSGVISSEHFVNGVNYIQTDVKISKGDNGSPLINKKGELIGIVNEKYLGSYLEGISFAVSAQDILSRLKLKYEN
jgi:serine protease Do